MHAGAVPGVPMAVTVPREALRRAECHTEGTGPASRCRKCCRQGGLARRAGKQDGGREAGDHANEGAPSHKLLLWTKWVLKLATGLAPKEETRRCAYERWSAASATSPGSLQHGDKSLARTLRSRYLGIVPGATFQHFEEVPKQFALVEVL